LPINAEPAPVPTIYPTPVDLPPPGHLLIPVQGVTADKLIDTFTDARSEGRTHDAIDIPAAAGTPVLAAADGEIVKFHDSVAGGITIYQTSVDKKYFFYYAHLQSRAAGIYEKQFVKQGTTIGYVGDTGNAGPGNYHLHFAISVVIDPKRYWEGISINPYTVFKEQAQLK
jgi:murein DD-endopeptidase MepM/ murein hydrolase activator NlpD